MAGGIAIVVAMVLVVPLGVMLVGAIWSATFGWIATEGADAPEPAEP